MAAAFLGVPSSPGGPAEASGGDGALNVEDAVSEEAQSVLSRAEETGYSVDERIEAAAGEVLRSYAAREGCVLARSGYLGILGDCWGCVVTGGEWAEVCVVTQQSDEERSEVRIWRIDANELEGLREEGVL